MGSCNFKYSGFCLEFRQIGGCIWLEGGACGVDAVTVPLMQSIQIFLY